MNAPATSPVPASAPAIPAQGDFPGWVPAMLVKELRQALRAKGFVGLFLVFHLFAILVFWWTMEINSASGLRETFNWLNGVFWGLLNVVLLLIVPLRGLGSLRVEIENKTLDLLVLTRLTAWRIVLGKWVALVAQAALFLLAVMPYGVVRYFFGSVDLAGDLLLAGWLFLAGCALAAVCIWVSGLPKIFRILLPIVLILAFQSFGLASVFASTMSGRSPMGRGMRATPLTNLGWTGTLILSLVIVVFLGLAVRRIAPPAENHAKSARLLGLFLLLGSAACAAAGVPGASELLGFGFAAVALVGAVELSRDSLPMRVHWSPWRGRGALRAAIGRVLLPGWPSASLFAAVALGLLAAVFMLVPAWRPSRTEGITYAWWLVLAWQALVFPAVLLSFLPHSSTMRIGGTGYFVVQGLFGTISLLSATNSTGFFTGEIFARSLDAICQVLPVFSFWLGAEATKTGFSTPNVIGQAFALAVLVALMWRQSRIYWGTVARFDQHAVEQPPRSP